MKKPGAAQVRKIRNIKLLVLDVDGVLTDGGIILGDDGRETKRFHVRDGHGIKLMIRAGIRIVLLTGRSSRVVEHRAKELGIACVYQGVKDKLAVYEEILSVFGYEHGEVAYMGDDIVDLPVLARVGWSMTVSDADEAVLEKVDWVSCKPGGGGAVREACDLILKTQGKWDDLMTRYRA